MSLLIDDILNVLKTSYGQVITTPEEFFMYKEDLEIACKTAVSEYSYYRPLTKVLRVQGSPQGVYLGEDVINVRNIRVTNNYFDKISPKLPRRYKAFDSQTHIFSSAYTMPLTIEVGCMYQMHRQPIKDQVILQALEGDTNLVVKLNYYNKSTLKIVIGDDSWSDLRVNYGSATSVLLQPSQGTKGTATIDIRTNVVTLKGLNIEETTPVQVSYNPVFSTIEGLTLRDKLFINLCIGHCLVSLGNIKTQLQMEGDVVNFNDNLIEQGQNLIAQTLESLENSSTTYANL